MQCHATITRNVLHGRFIVQSNVKGPDALIERINSFLLDSRDNKVKNLTDEEVELSKRALIKALEQKDLKLSDEVTRRWSIITDDNGLYEFDRRYKKIAALEKVTKDQVQALYNNMIFEDSRRLNIKLYSHIHHANVEEMRANVDLNRDFYLNHCNIIAPREVTKITNPKAFKLGSFMFPRL